MLDQTSLNTLKQIVRKYLPDQAYKTFVFGSRVNGSNRKFSDIDLGVKGPKELSAKEYIMIKNEFDDSDLPYRVDLIDFANVSDKFKQMSLNNIINL